MPTLQIVKNVYTKIKCNIIQLNIMKSTTFLFMLALLTGCSFEDEQLRPIQLHLPPHELTVWKLSRVQYLNEEWRAASAKDLHELRFTTNGKVEFVHSEGACSGTYILEESSNTTSLMLKDLPCSVPAPHMWQSHLIVSLTDSLVVTEPRLNPTAFKSSVKFEYRISH